MWYFLKFETYFILIALLVIIVRAFYRERDSGKFFFIMCCYLNISAFAIRSLRLCFTYVDYSYLYYIFEALDLIIWMAIPFCWMCNSYERLGYKVILRHRVNKFLFPLPLVIGAAIVAASPVWGLAYKLNLFGEGVEGPYYIVLQGVVVIYSLLTLAIAIRSFLSRNTISKIPAITTAITCTLFCVIQLVSSFKYSALFYLACSFVLIGRYLSLHEDRVFIDALTGLNNRNRFRKYLISILGSQSTREHMFLTYIDVDDFKSINDNYGHITGDLALRTVSEAMREVATSRHAFIARLGGDEFAIISKHANDEDLYQMLNELNLLLDQKARNNFKKFTVKFSVGYTPIDNPCYTLNDLIKIADRNMYDQKQAKKAAAKAGV